MQSMWPATNIRPIEWVREGDCFRCTSHFPKNGYPAMARNGIERTIARWILVKRLGNISSNVVARHTCDNKWCIRPDHIIHGSVADNNRDRAERGRNADVRGEKNNSSKLTPEQVLEIRSASGSCSQIGSKFGVSKGLVSSIKNRKLWKHL